jgi:sulfite reductase (NADPH) hemoprotein beta-component
MLQMIIANTLADGFVVFLTEDNSWTNDIAAGALAETDEQAESLLNLAKQAEQANLVIDPYLIPVELDAGLRKPTEYREYIRAMGPTVPIPS